MYKTILQLHSYLAYAVLAVLLVAVINAFIGLIGKKEFSLNKDFRISLFALVLSHLQLLVGLILYFLSPNGLNAIQENGMGGLSSAARLLSVEHPFINIIALILITIGWSKHKKTTSDSKKFRLIAILYGLGLVLYLSRIPYGQWF